MIDPDLFDLLTLGQAVRELREQRGLTTDELAERAQTAPDRLAALEAGRLDPDYALLVALAGAIGVRPSAIFLRTEALAARAAERRPEDG